MTRTNGYLGAVLPWACALMLAACGGDDPVSVTEFSVSLTLSSVTLLPGETVIVDAQAIDSQGSTLFGKTFTWTSSDSTVAGVEPLGTSSVLLTAVGEGSATIEATSEGQSAMAAVTVTVGGLFAFTSAGSGGYSHSCGLAVSGTAYCWGSNNLPISQLGNDTTDFTSTPLAVSPDLTFTSLSSGGVHTCGITTSSAAYCWGWNEDGQLGNGFISESGAPAPVSGELTFASVSAGFAHTCGVTTGGVAYCWGRNTNGILGDGTTTGRETPVPVLGNLTFASISAGSGPEFTHTCGVTTTGAAYCWGKNYHGSLGDQTTSDSLEPVAVSGGLIFASVSTGEAHSCGLTTSGSAYCWGWNASGQLGDGFTIDRAAPVPVIGDLTFSSIGLGTQHTCGVTTTGAGYCWGMNDSGQLGNGDQTGPFDAQPTPQPISGRLTFESLSGGLWHTCGVVTSGAAYCWGWNQVGMLGNGDGGSKGQLFETYETRPVRVIGPS